ncbi:hypothetical protein LCGC14_2699920, partial [marine sediment metagenome]
MIEESRKRVDEAARKESERRWLVEAEARNEKLLEELKRERRLREQIEQRCDPAGDTRALILTRDENEQLR